MGATVLITGEHSVLGQACLTHLHAQGYQVNTLSVRKDTWKTQPFIATHVLHVAGLAHVSYKTQDNDLYDSVNHRLAFEVASKAKADGVKHFIFFSTMLVLGESTARHKPFDLKASPNPQNPYSQSKHRAEEALQTLADATFTVTIMRLPFVYGPMTKGNYQKLSRLAQKLPIFPKTTNQRTMLYIGHLVVWVEALIKNPYQGIVYPQNEHAVSTSTLFKSIRQAHHKKTLLLPGVGYVLAWLSPLHPTLRKLFGSFAYGPTTKDPFFVNDVHDFETTIRLSEGGAVHG